MFSKNENCTIGCPVRTCRDMWGEKKPKENWNKYIAELAGLAKRLACIEDCKEQAFTG